jgi:20S proteasome subunit beta 1
MTYSNKDWLSAGLIVAGFDEKTGGEIYTIPLGGSLHKQEYSIAGSGSSYIYGYCDKNFKSGFTREEAISFVKQSLSQAIKWDGSSGGVIRIVIITKDKTDRLIFYPDEYEEA